MARGWTGGQYSMLRVALAAIAVAHGIGLAATLQPPPLTVAAVAGVVAAGVAIAAGAATRLAATALLASSIAIAWATGANPVPTWVLAALLAPAWLLPAPTPFGSVAARGRTDPGGGWRMPDAATNIGTVLFMVIVSWTGFRLLLVIDFDDPTPNRFSALGLALLIGLAGLTLRRLRPWAWLSIALVVVSGLVTPSVGPERFTPLAGFVASWLLAFEPRWIPPCASRGGARLFYDGSCGMCHGSVRLLLAEEPRILEHELRVAPLHGPTFEAEIPPERRASLPDSVVLLEADGTLQTRSRATIALGRRLGGLWRLGAEAIALLPRASVDALYDAIARVRYRIFGRREAACPLLPPALAARFDP